jgi:hypothetical protein
MNRRKYLQYMIVIIIAFILSTLIAAALTNNKYSVERSIVINKPTTQVYDYIKNLRNQCNYSKWGLMDPNMKKWYIGTDATTGFIYCWDSKNDNVGAGEQEIKRIIEGRRIDYDLRFSEPSEILMKSYMATDSVGVNQTLVTWSFNGKNGYYSNLINIFMDGLIGDEIILGLNNLKKIMERKP